MRPPPRIRVRQARPEPARPRLILFNKPYGVLTQFTDSGGRKTLADFIPARDVYPAGRLDFDSEGLVVLTNSGKLQHEIADPSQKLPKVYWAQVEGTPDAAALAALARGVKLSDGLARATSARRIDDPGFGPRTPPIRERRHIPTAWIEVALIEGRHRQVRRMTAAVGHPTLRLVRVAVGPWKLGTLREGEWKEGRP
ncbi:MAG TPA: pseudouridine synthase [Candidatus Eisenbacteria bacterium]|nr:pseudouridine synthase [Candidatus Eisenbacteria bacterium]